MNAELSESLTMHQKGRYADAARRDLDMFVREPEPALALPNFGVMHHESGESARAIELFKRAGALRPSETAEIHRSLGQYEDAVACCLEALKVRPNFPEVANQLGLAYEALGRFDDAIAQFQEAFRLRRSFGLARSNLGVLLRNVGRCGEALEVFRAAVEVEPTLAKARANLGQALLDFGAIEEGLFHCQEAVRLDPNQASAYNNLGNAYRLSGNWEEAHAAYAEAARLGPELYLVHFNRGSAFAEEGKPLRAAACFERAAEIADDDPALWQALTDAHLAGDDPSAAVPWLDRLVAHQPDDPWTLNQLGWVLQYEGRYKEADVRLRRALELTPDFVEGLVNQANLYEELGDVTRAEANYRRAIELHPRTPGPYAKLANLLRERLPEQDREALREWLADPELGEAQRSTLLFALANVCDALGERLETASCLEEANAIALREREKKGKTYSSIEHHQFVERLIECFSRELFERLAAAGDETDRPVFVFGVPRSGTTLVEQVLSSHSRVHGAGEILLASRTFDSIPKVVGRNEILQECLDAFDACAVNSLSAKYQSGLEAVLKRQGRADLPDRVVDKMPDNYLYLGLLSLLFPRATFIHVSRDPRDAAFSCWLTNFSAIRWANSKEDIAGRFLEERRIMNHWRSALRVRIHEVVYEQFIDDFESEAKRLVAACGLEWEPACLDFHQNSRPVRTASVTQVRKPLYRGAVGRWRGYEAPLAELFSKLPVITELNHESN